MDSGHREFGIGTRIWGQLQMCPGPYPAHIHIHHIHVQGSLSCTQRSLNNTVMTLTVESFLREQSQFEGLQENFYNGSGAF